MRISPLVLLLFAVLRCGSAAVAQAATIETVPVRNSGNEGESSGGSSEGGFGPDRICGAVDYSYNIGKYEVTAGQYCEFLNAVAKTDAYGLYNARMDSDPRGCQITRHGASGNYTYDFSGGTVESPKSTASDWKNRAVNYVSWGDAARFANWLHNGQPTKVQDSTTTEDGAYCLKGATSRKALMAVSRESDWKWAISSEDEWYKAAYHKNDGDTNNYFDYPTSSDTAPGYVNNSGKLSGTGTAFAEGGIDPGNYASFDGDEGTVAGGKPYYRTKVGEWENSGSPYKTFDQGGNVWEWNEVGIDGSRGLRGAAADDEAGDLRASFRYYYNPMTDHPYIGFRVVRQHPIATTSDATTLKEHKRHLTPAQLELSDPVVNSVGIGRGAPREKADQLRLRYVVPCRIDREGE